MLRLSKVTKSVKNLECSNSYEFYKSLKEHHLELTATWEIQPDKYAKNTMEIENLVCRYLFLFYFNATVLLKIHKIKQSSYWPSMSMPLPVLGCVKLL